MKDIKERIIAYIENIALGKSIQEREDDAKIPMSNILMEFEISKTQIINVLEQLKKDEIIIGYDENYIVFNEFDIEENYSSIATYKEENGSLQMQKSFCVYFDILGFSEKIQSDDIGYFNKYSEVLKTLLDNLNDFRRNIRSPFEIKIFTDNFIIGYPWWDDETGESELGDVFDIVSYIQYNFAIQNIFIRGAVTLSELYMDKNVVFGKALIEAYELESTKTIYPRVILSNDVRLEVDKHLEYYLFHQNSPQYVRYLIDIDGQYFLNYLIHTAKSTSSDIEAKQLLQKHKTIIEKNLEIHSNNFPLYQKYVWVGKYHNFFCMDFLKEPLPDLVIESSLLNKSITTIKKIKT